MMRVPDLENIIEQESDAALELAVTRIEVWKTLLAIYDKKRKESFTTALEVFDLVKYVCSFNKNLRYGRLFSDICGVYKQLGYTVMDMPAKGGEPRYSDFYTRGVIEALEYILSRETFNNK